MKILITLLLGLAMAHATRPQISPAQKDAWTPRIFEAKVTKVTTVPAPNKETYFTNNSEALKVEAEVVHTWKGAHEKNVTLYTWAPGKAPCTGVEVIPGKNYIFGVEQSPKSSHWTFDLCGSAYSAELPGAPQERERLNVAFPDKKR